MINKLIYSLKPVTALIFITLSMHTHAESWDSLASKNKSLNWTIITSSIFTIDTKNNSVKIRNEWPQDCDNTYGTKYGVIALNSKQIKLKFTCHIGGKYGRDSFEIATEQGMKYAFDFLKKHKKFTYQITTPKTVRGKNKLIFQKTLNDVIDNPLSHKIINEKTKGMWVGIEGTGNKYFLFENIKNKRDNLLHIIYDSDNKNITLKIDLSKVRRTDNRGYSVVALGACEYLKFKNKTGVLYINEYTIKFPLECKHVNIETSITGIDFSLVPSVGYLATKEVTIQANTIKNITTLKDINISFEFQGIQKKHYNKSITIKRTILETINSLEAKQIKDKREKKDLKNTIEKKVDNAI